MGRNSRIPAVGFGDPGGIAESPAPPSVVKTKATWGIVAAVSLGLALNLGRLLRPNALFGIVEYDDGVYVGAAVRLVHGVMPYRDFVFGHPPGILVLLAPIAFAATFLGTRAAMGMGRVETALVGVANIFLLARLVRHRGLLPVCIAGGFLALFPAGVFAVNTVMLEPYLVLFCLLGATAMFAGDEPAGRRRICFAGLSFGFAGAVKIWAVLPAAVAMACCLPRVRRDLVPLVAGFTVGSAILTLPFFFVAPDGYVRQVFEVQLSRSPSPGLGRPVGDRLVYMTGLPSFPSVTVAIVVAAAVVVLTAAAFVVRPRPTRLDWFAAGTASTTAAALLLAPDFGFHYAYFSAVFLALLLATASGRIAGAVSVKLKLRGRPARRLAPVVGGLIVAGVAVTAVRNVAWNPHAYDPGPGIAARIPAGACVVTDAPALAIVADRFVPARAGCPANVDPFFTWLVADPKHPPPQTSATPPVLVRTWQDWLAAANYLVLSPDPFRIPWTPTLRTWVDGNFELVSSADVVVYRRVGRASRPEPK